MRKLLARAVNGNLVLLMKTAELPHKYNKDCFSYPGPESKNEHVVHSERKVIGFVQSASV